MARIRTIKPELPQSESMGRCSRDARLCFILLWTQADDAGRLRGNSRMLASILFPYDNDASGLIEGWFKELEAQECIRRYTVKGHSYVEITKWLEHQKIDKPSKSKLPAFDDGSREVAKPREVSSGEGTEGSRIKDQGPGVAANGSETKLPTGPMEIPNLRPERAIRNLDPAEQQRIRKERWEQNVINFINRVWPQDRADEAIRSYMEKEDHGISEFNKASKEMKRAAKSVTDELIGRTINRGQAA